MARTTLIGDYGSINKVTFGAEIIAAAVLADGTWYLITAVDASASGFDAGMEVGYIALGDGVITLAGDDTAKPITFTAQCDIQGWNLEFSKDEIEVTTLCDDQKKYLAGKSDVTGSSTGVYKIGITDVNDGIQNAFVDIVTASGTYTIDKLNDELFYGKFITQEKTDSGETEEFYIAPINFTTFSQGATSGEAQTFESAFRIAPDETNNVVLAYYKYTHA